jgi:hypothetical protein
MKPMVVHPTSGKSLAEHPALPAKLGALMASVAENLELHMKTLDLKDKKAKKQYKAYAGLAREHRNIAASLQAIADEMERYRDLDRGKPNEDALSDPKILAAFGKFVKAEMHLIASLQRRMRRDSKMLSPRRPKEHD